MVKVLQILRTKTLLQSNAISKTAERTADEGKKAIVAIAIVFSVEKQKTGDIKLN